MVLFRVILLNLCVAVFCRPLTKTCKGFVSLAFHLQCLITRAVYFQPRDSNTEESSFPFISQLSVICHPCLYQLGLIAVATVGEGNPHSV